MRLSKWFTCTIPILFASPALATLITFDDMPEQYIPEHYDPYFDPFLHMPVTTEYDHLGVNFGNDDLDLIVQGIGNHGGAAITRPEDGAVSAPNAISNSYSTDLTFTFIGDELPGYVSFYVTGVDGVGISVTAYDDTGAIVADLQSDGWWGLPEWSTPAVPWQLMEIEGHNIQKVYLSNLYDRRSMIQLDNLYFSPAHPVPEAATWPLLATGLLGLALVRLRTPAIQVVSRGWSVPAHCINRLPVSGSCCTVTGSGLN